MLFAQGGSHRAHARIALERALLALATAALPATFLLLLVRRLLPAQANP